MASENGPVILVGHSYGGAVITEAGNDPKVVGLVYLLTTDDRMIPAAAQRLMAKRAGATVVEVKGSHAIFVSQPHAVASLIEKAAKGVQ